MMGIRGTVGLTVLALVWMAAGPWAASAQTGVEPDSVQTVRTVETVGMEPIESDDFSRAREKAIHAGLVNAVEIVVQDLVAGRAEDGATIPVTLAARIEDQPTAFIRNYRVVEEDAGGDGETYMAMVEATVAVDLLERALADKPDVLPAAARPSILLAIAEQGVNEFSPRYWWGGDTGGGLTAAAGALGRVLGDLHYPLVDYRTAARDSRFTAAFAHPELTDRQALDLASRLGADVVIHGQARAEAGPVSLVTKIRTSQGTLKVRVLHVGSGGLVAEMEETAVTVGADEREDGSKALSRVGTIVAEGLEASLAALAKRPAGDLLDLEVTVTGTGDLPGFVRLRRAITALPGVGNLRIVAFQQDSAVMQIAFEGNAERLRDLLNQRLAAEMDVAIEALDISHLLIALPAFQKASGDVQENALGN